MHPEGDRATPRGWRAHRSLQGPSALAENIPSKASLWGVKTPQVHTSWGPLGELLWHVGGSEEDRRWRTTLREVPALPSKGPGQPPWELSLPSVLLIERRRLLPKEEAISKPSASQARSARPFPSQGPQ